MFIQGGGDINPSPRSSLSELWQLRPRQTCQLPAQRAKRQQGKEEGGSGQLTPFPDTDRQAD